MSINAIIFLKKHSNKYKILDLEECSLGFKT